MPVDKRISELDPSEGIQPTDLSVLVDGAVDYKWTFAQLLTFLSSNLNIGANISFGTVTPLDGTGINGDVFIKTTTQQFFQRLAGIWTVVYTIAAPGTLDGTTIYGTSTPPAVGTGSNGDTYINTLTGIFYKKTTGAWAQVFSMASGPSGPRGNSVLNGTVDPINTTGVNGDFYINDTSKFMFGPKSGGIWPVGFSMVGIDGNTILHGDVNPINTLGKNGDYYINDTTFYIFGPKAAGAWTSGVSFMGVGIPDGGTDGQILSKISSDDFEVNWIDNSFANIIGEPTDNTDLAAALAAKQNSLGFTPENAANRNIANGYAGLDSGGKVAAAQLPSYVDDVLECANFAALPASGETGKIYVTLDTNAEYRWSGSTYIQLVASPGSTDAVPEGSTNLYFTIARVLASILTGISFGSVSAVLATDTILGALGKLQAQLTSDTLLIKNQTASPQTGGINVSSTVTAGSFIGNSIQNASSPNNAKMSFGNTGISGSRNIADANPILKLGQLNLGATGPFIDFKVQGRDVYKVNVNGSVTNSSNTTASGGIAIGDRLNCGLAASANGDVLIGAIDHPIFGVTKIAGLDTLVSGGGYTDQTVVLPLTGGTGQYATATITVSAGGVASCTIVDPGLNYTIGDILSATIFDVTGNPAGAGFTIRVSGIVSYTGVIKIARQTVGLDTYDQDYSATFTQFTKIDKNYGDKTYLINNSAYLNQKITSWTNATAYALTSITRDGNGAIATASIVWPDGSTGTFTTDTASTAFPGAIDAFHLTYIPTIGLTKTITQGLLTRDVNGAVIAQPILTIV